MPITSTKYSGLALNEKLEEFEMKLFSGMLSISIFPITTDISFVMPSVMPAIIGAKMVAVERMEEVSTPSDFLMPFSTS